jgi:hypothetical protein
MKYKQLLQKLARKTLKGLLILIAIPTVTIVVYYSVTFIKSQF